MKLTDILSKEDWAQFENELFDRFHINCTVYDASGTSIIGEPNWCNRLCPEIKSYEESLGAICAAANQDFRAEAKQTETPVIGECDAGLMKISVPIFVEGEFLGAAGGCGLLPESGEVETFLIEKTSGLSEEEIADLCDGLGTMTEEEAQEMAEFIEKRIDQYVKAAV